MNVIKILLLLLTINVKENNAGGAGLLRTIHKNTTQALHRKVILPIRDKIADKINKTKTTRSNNTDGSHEKNITYNKPSAKNNFLSKKVIKKNAKGSTVEESFDDNKFDGIKTRTTEKLYGTKHITVTEKNNADAITVETFADGKQVKKETMETGDGNTRIRETFNNVGDDGIKEKQTQKFADGTTLIKKYFKNNNKRETESIYPDGKKTIHEYLNEGPDDDFWLGNGNYSLKVTEISPNGHINIKTRHYKENKIDGKEEVTQIPSNGGTL